jgi:hypothetical protein
MDVLGLLSGLLSYRQPLHRRSRKLWSQERNVCAISRLSTATGNRLLFVSDAVLRLHRTARNWWILRARSHFAVNDFRFLLGNYCLLPDRLLDLERK